MAASASEAVREASPELIIDTIMSRVSLLQLASQPEGADPELVTMLQASQCVGVQAFCHANDWPPGLLKTVFFLLLPIAMVVLPHALSSCLLT